MEVGWKEDGSRMEGGWKEDERRMEVRWKEDKMRMKDKGWKINERQRMEDRRKTKDGR